MTIQHHAETLRLRPPRTARFLRRSIPTSQHPNTTYVPRDAGLRAEQHRPGKYGDVRRPAMWGYHRRICSRRGKAWRNRRRAS